MAKVVQSVIFNKKQYTPAEAMAWLLEHDFKINKIHTTEKYHRFNQFKPDNKDESKRYFTIDSKDYEGIKFVIFG